MFVTIIQTRQVLKAFEKVPPEPVVRLTGKANVSESLSMLIAETDAEMAKHDLKAVAVPKVERAAAYDEICALEHALTLSGCGLSNYITVHRDTTWKDMPTSILAQDETRKLLQVPDSHFTYPAPAELQGTGKMAVAIRPKGMAQERKWEVQQLKKGSSHAWARWG